MLLLHVYTILGTVRQILKLGSKISRGLSWPIVHCNDFMAIILFSLNHFIVFLVMIVFMQCLNIDRMENKFDISV